MPPTEAVGRRLAQMLADLSQAWTLATPTERNAIAHEVCAAVVVQNRTAVAVKPRPELAPFFASLECQPDASITQKRKRADRSAGLSLRELGQRYGVSAEAVRMALKRDATG